MAKRTTSKTPSTEAAPAAARRKRTTAAPTDGAPKTPRTRRRTTASVEAVATDAVNQAAAEAAAESNGQHEPTAHDIAVRAYYIALERGYPGDPVADWLQAEQQLKHAGA